MKISTRMLSVVVVLAAVSAARQGRTDTGSVWIEEVTNNSVTLNWSDPSGTHRLAITSPEPGYKISWREVNSKGPSNELSVSGSSSKPYTISGLSSDKYYEFRVEVNAEKRTWYGKWMNPWYREVGSVHQTIQTRQAPSDTSPRYGLRVADTSDTAINIVFTNTDPDAHDKIRIAYKRKFSDEPLNATAKLPDGPETEWVESNEERGWVDMLSTASELEATFPALSRCARYEIVAYGFQIGPSEGELLGQVMAETAGNCLHPDLNTAVAVDHLDILRQYVDEVGPEKIGAAVEACIVEQGDAVDFKTHLKDEGDDPADVLSLVVNLTRFRPELWECAESRLPISPDKFMGVEPADLYFELKNKIVRELDKVPVEFVRGDANGDGVVDISDPQFILQYLFTGGRAPLCFDAVDSNDDGGIDIADPQFVLNFLFVGGSQPPAPGPFACGPDTEEDSLDCHEYTSCAPTPSS